jgi:hypothetical protein
MRDQAMLACRVAKHSLASAGRPFQGRARRWRRASDAALIYIRRDAAMWRLCFGFIVFLVSHAADRVRRDRPERIARPAHPGGRGGERSEPPLMT